MAIFKSKQVSNYTTVPNDVISSGLSPEALGMLVYLLSLPHDWIIYKMTIHTHFNCGREKADRIFKELQQAGYIISAKKISADGRIEYQHIVYDKPFNGEPLGGKPLTVDTELLNTNIQKTNIQSKQDYTCADDFQFSAEKKEIKPKQKKKEFTPPTEEEVVAYFAEHRVDRQLAVKAFNHYSKFGWKDSKGKPVVNWKQKMYTNWIASALDNASQPQKIKVRYMNAFGYVDRFVTSEELERLQADKTIINLTVYK